MPSFSSGDPRIPKRKRAQNENPSLFGSGGNQVSLLNQIPLELRLLSSLNEDDRIQQEEYEREEHRLMLERMRKQKEKERSLAMIARGTADDTESEESSGEDCSTDWHQEIAKFKSHPLTGRPNLKLKGIEQKQV